MFAWLWSNLKVEKIFIKIIYFFLSIFALECRVWIKIILTFILIILNIYLLNLVWFIVFGKYHIICTILISNMIFTYCFSAGVKIYVICILVSCFLFFLFSNFILFKQLMRANFINLKHWDLKVVSFLIFSLYIFRFFWRVLSVIGLAWLLTLRYPSLAFSLRRLTPFFFTIA